MGEGVEIASRDDASGSEAQNRLGEAADVVGDDRDTRAERLQERPRLVELGAVGEDGDRRLRECPLELHRLEVAESPFGARCLRQLVERHRRIARDEEASVGEAAYELDGVGKAFVGADDAEREQRLAVVGPDGSARVDGVGDDGRLDAELAQRLTAAFAVHHDAVEAAQQALPEPTLGGGSAGEEIMGGEDRGAAEAERDVDLGDGEPLHVEHVGAQARQRRHDAEVLDALERQA